MADYQCRECGIIMTGQSDIPYPKSLGSCPRTATGNHIWSKMGRCFKPYFLLLILVLSTICCYSQSTQGLIAYYPLNSTSADSSGDSNEVDEHGIEYEIVDKTKKVYAAKFNGSSFLELPINVLNDLSAATIYAKIKITKPNIQHTIVDKTVTGRSNYFQLIIDNNNRLRVIINDKYFRGTTELKPTIYYQIICTFDGTKLKLFINNKLDNQFPCTESILNFPTSTYIGKVENNTAFFNGTIQNIRVYNKCLSDSEIENLVGSKISKAIQPLDANYIAGDNKKVNTLSKIEYDGVYLQIGMNKYLYINPSPAVYGRFGRCVGGYSDFDIFQTWFAADLSETVVTNSAIQKIIVVGADYINKIGTFYLSEITPFTNGCVWNLNTDTEYSFAGRKVANIPQRAENQTQFLHISLKKKSLKDRIEFDLQGLSLQTEKSYAFWSNDMGKLFLFKKR